MRITLLEPVEAGHPHTSGGRAVGIDSRTVLDTLALVVPENELPPIELICEWTPLEQLMVYDYAIREHLVARGHRVQRRARPHVSKYTAPRVWTREEWMANPCTVCAAKPHQPCSTYRQGMSDIPPLTTGDYGPEFHEERRPK